MAKSGVREKITLACTECKRRNYESMKSKRNTPDRVEFKKFCRWCGHHTPHRETDDRRLDEIIERRYRLPVPERG